MPVKDHDLGRTELVASSDSWNHLPAKSRVGREEAERDQAMRLAAAHCLGEIEGTVLRLTGQAVKTALDQELQARSEVVASEEVPTIHPAGREILDLRNLFDQAVAGDDRVRDAKLSDSRDWHVHFLI